ncbi:unnamed protein product [Caenorhabditis angaria]|uniref:Uncharacterized protein n=1 Tax=Caenorhabditis angaria TaxID=860376 RepID=A0A9P1NB05_9PELO|nr:unnamed protein product [Caenorhabditis angaria]
MRGIILILLPAVVFSQSGSGGEEVVENAENFRRLYGIATKIMELSGNIMGNGGNGGGNGYDEVRPRFQGVRSFTEDNSILSGGSQSGGINNMARMLKEYQGMFANANFVQQTTTTTTTERPNDFKSILDSFLGTGNSGPITDSDTLPPPPTPKPRQRGSLFSSFLGGGNNGGVSSSGNSAQAQTTNEAANLFGKFFGMMPRETTTTTTTEATPVQKIMNMFVPQSENRESSSSSSRGKINFLELFGMAPRTTTTTAQPPLQALFAPNKPYNGSPEDLDGIMNALLRSNARPTRQEPASILSQFFGRK